MTSGPASLFVEDLERTEYSDSIQAIIGRSLILATSFDSLCIELSRTMNMEQFLYNNEDIEFSKLEKFVAELYKNDMSLCDTIKSFRFAHDWNDILHKARKARNKIAHSICNNLTGCLETNPHFNENVLLEEISSLSKVLIEGDALVSLIISIVTKEPLPRYDYISKQYKNELLQWVIEP